jgi:hypothetical protein
LSNDIGWFKEYYDDCEGVPVIIHPAEALNNDAYLGQPFWILRESVLEELKNNTAKFFNSLSGTELNDLSPDIIVQKLKYSCLDTHIMMKHYLRRVEERKVTR